MKKLWLIVDKLATLGKNIRLIIIGLAILLGGKILIEDTRWVWYSLGKKKES